MVSWGHFPCYFKLKNRSPDLELSHVLYEKVGGEIYIFQENEQGKIMKGLFIK